MSSSKITQPEINLSYLFDLSKNDPLFVMDIIRLFLQEIPEALVSIEEAYQNKNWVIVSKRAHRMKSNYMMVGMAKQQQIALEIEVSTSSGEFNPTYIGQLIDELREDSIKAYPIMREKLELIEIIG